MIDLHIHTTASDGEFSPQEIIDLAIKKGLKAIAITDHDSISGCKEAIEYADNKDIEVVPGIEMSCYEEERGFVEVHILGLFVDYNNKELLDFCENSRKERIKQKRRIIEKLNAFGFEIGFEEVSKIVKSSFGRPHIAKVLIRKYPQEFLTVKSVFEKYLGIGKPAYVEKENRARMKDAVNLIRKAGGIPFLAHPGIFKKNDSLELIKLFKEAGGEGLETYYPYHIIYLDLNIDKQGNKKIIEFYQQIARENNLLESGGNDFHDLERGKLGEVEIPMGVLTKIKAKKF